MNISDTTVDEIINRILNVTQPRRVILFGSAVGKNFSADSDIDLLIVRDNIENSRELTTRLRNALRGLNSPFDILLISTKRFEETKNILGGIAYPAEKYGETIYESHPHRSQ